MFMTTSNGTRAIENSANGSKNFYKMTFLNVESVAKNIRREC